MIILNLLLALLNVYAHEGHIHGPAAVPALHGGTVYKSKISNVEFVQEGELVKIFTDKPVKVVKVKFTQGKNKVETNATKKSENEFEVNYEKIKPGRFNLSLIIEDEKNKDTLMIKAEKQQ